MSHIIRGAASLLILLHPSITNRPEGLGEKILNAYESSPDDWYLRAIQWVFQISVHQNDPLAEEVIGRLLAKTRGDFKKRSGLEELMVHWREISTFPVSRGELHEKWLAE
jgi:hypothetical protein